jgi:serine O-acetyltransferase
VVLCYPGVHAIWLHRVAHRLWNAGWRTLGRVVPHVNRFATGIEIHPAAKLGPGLFIDHGMGIVIGETAEVGENVSLLQGVTLGGTSVRREKRHPTLGDNAAVGAGRRSWARSRSARAADRRRLGRRARGARELRRGRRARTRHLRDGRRVDGEIDLNQVDLPDPLARAVEQLMDRIQSLEHELETLKQSARS